MINVSNLTKTYANGKGIFSVSFRINQGEAFGYLGPNGAGKTTTIRNLLGFLKPIEGKCEIAGKDCWLDTPAILKNLGYLPGEIAFFDNMTGNEFLDFLGDIRGASPRKEELVQMFELDLGQKIAKMSKGTKQKVALVAAFMHDPEILILDEPTSGLDPLMQSRFIELIHQEKTRNKTILMSSHHFEEIDRTCDRVAIINEGRIVAVEDIHKIKAERRTAYLVSVKTGKEALRLASKMTDSEIIANRTVKVYISNNYNQFIAVLSEFN